MDRIEPHLLLDNSLLDRFNFLDQSVLALLQPCVCDTFRLAIGDAKFASHFPDLAIGLSLVGVVLLVDVFKFGRVLVEVHTAFVFDEFVVEGVL